MVVNLSKNPQAAELNLENFEGYVPKEIFGKTNFPTIKNSPYQITLNSYGYYWFALEKTNTSASSELTTVPESTLLEEFINGNSSSIFAYNILPGYLQKCRWFGGKALTVQQVEIKSVIPSGESNAYILLLKVIYNDGFPEIYFLPVAFAEITEGQKIEREFPSSIISKVKLAGKEGFIYDAIYSEAFREDLLKLTVGTDVIQAKNLKLWGDAAEKITATNINSKIVGVEQSNTSIIYNDQYFLKIYRKVDNHFNPDVEVTRFLTERKNFTYSPVFLSSLYYKVANETFTIGLLQKLIHNEGDAWSYFGNEAKIFLEKIKSSNTTDINSDLLGKNIIDKAVLLGKRTAELHIALSSKNDDPNFETEWFSLHYQSSLYAGLYSMVRSSFSTLNKQLPKLPDYIRPEAENLEKLRPEILNKFKRLTLNKIDSLKTRTHGDYHLGQVLVSNNDFVIIDFEGEPARPFSERRLKKSPVKDVAGMLRSFHYAMYAALLQGNFTKEEIKNLQGPAEAWYKIMYGAFLESYLKEASGHSIIPENKNDFTVLLETFILEKAIYELNYELIYRPDWIVIPIEGIKAIMKG